MAASIKSSKSSSSSSSAFGSNIQWKYDVFLSFRGEDTRNNFTGHLYNALKHRGIYTFRDDDRLERGKEISSELLEAIEESRFSILILSENYASSRWCLVELSKIVECMESQEHTVFPVFYKVDPSDVRKQTGDFKTAFDKHEQDFKDKPEMVKRWRSALEQVGNIAGWDLKDGSEANLIEVIVGNISRRLINLLPSVVGEQLVGVESRVEEIYKLLELELDDRVTFVGICGMGGIGKTTIARVVYERLSNKYEGSCFLANVREISEKRGVVHLQQMLLSKILHDTDLNICDGYEGISLIRRRLWKKKVFLVLDDVDQLEQLEQLAGRNDWFGSGSRIIITTRDEHVLVSHGINNLYRVQGFNYDDARSLFHLKAFKNIQLTTDHVELLKDAVCYANGLPLALKVLGSLLCDRSVNQWKSALKRLREVPNEKIMKILRISYDALGKLDKKIFLDIACFFKRKDRVGVMEILNSCNFHPDIGFEVLRERSLISIGTHNTIWMHDLIQEMGWEVVREEHPDEPCKWSRLWLFEDIYQVLAKNTGTPSVEAIVLVGDRQRKEITHLKLNGKSFSGMSNLRLLIINDVDVHLFEDLEYLSNELRFLKWHDYPLKSLPSSFQPQRLVQLSLCYSRIEYIWKDIKPSMKYLKTINLSFSHNLIKTPDFEMIPNLERLDLQYCTKLCEVHKSIGSLGKLIVLNLNGCSNLVVFLSDVCGLKSLKILNLNGCSKLDTLPLNLEEVEPLEELDISGTAIEQFVISSIVELKNLKTLSLRGCKVGPPKTWSFSLIRSWLTLPTRKSGCMGLMLPPFAGLSSLKKLDVSDCNLLEIPSDIGSFFSLEELKLGGNNFVSLPDSISQLARLGLLDLKKCQRLQSLPKLPPKIALVFANDCTSLKTISSALELNSRNTWLEFSNCFQLVESQGRNNGLEIMLLKRWLQINEISNLYTVLDHPFFYVHLPGSEIPEWFSYWSEGSTITWTPPHCLSNDELIGFCVCAVISIPDHSYDVEIVCGLGRCEYRSSHCKGDDHFWLVYFSKINHRNMEGEYDCGKGVTAWFEVRDSKNREKKNSNSVKRCGIHPVYKQDDLYELSATTDGAITMPSTLQGSRFRKCIYCIQKEINVDYSEDNSMEEGDTGAAVDNIGNSIYIADQSEIQKVENC